jgi:hypothetical protein
LSQNLGTYFGLPAKIIEAKAERDPDWFLEKADEMEEKLGIDMFDLLEESDAKQQSGGKGGRTRGSSSQSSVDQELDNVLDEVGQESQPQQQTESTKQEQSDMTNARSDHPMKSNAQQEVDAEQEQKQVSDGGAVEDSEDAGFDEIFGGD